MGKWVSITLLLTLLLTVSAFMNSDQVHADPSIKVLHVSSFRYNETQEIINIAGASSLFEVTQVGILDFNNGNPSNLSTYDAIVFGMSNRFEGPDAYYTPYAGIIGRISELKNYVNQGGGIVWTHDSLEHGNDYGADAEEPAGVDHGPGSSGGSATAKIINEHEVLHYPFEIGNVGDTIGILQTHTWYGYVTTATIVMMFDGQPAGPDNFYLTVHEYGNGRVAVIELGCLTLIEYDGTFGSWPSVTESRVFVNALYWTSGAEALPLAVSINPLSASILIGQSVTFTSTVNGGTTPYSYQWYLDGSIISSATLNTWTFTPSTVGIYYVYLKVTDAGNSTTQSETARVAVTATLVGGYSISIGTGDTTKPLTINIALVVGLTLFLAIIKRKERRRN